MALYIIYQKYIAYRLKHILNFYPYLVSFFLDYDSNWIGFLYYDHGSQYQSFPLTKGPLTTDGYLIQKQWTLRAPGNKLTAYYEDNSYRTIAIQLEMDDQSVYSISGLDTSEEDYHYDELELSGKGYFLDIEPNN